MNKNPNNKIILDTEIMIRVPSVLKEQFRTLSNKNGRSMSNYGGLLIAECVADNRIDSINRNKSDKG